MKLSWILRILRWSGGWTEVGKFEDEGKVEGEVEQVEDIEVEVHKVKTDVEGVEIEEV